MSEGDRSAFIKNMVDGLAQDLKENPNNLNGWLNLGRSYGVLGQWQKSADAYKQATELSPNDQKIKELYTSAIANLNQYNPHYSAYSVVCSAKRSFSSISYLFAAGTDILIAIYTAIRPPANFPIKMGRINVG